MTKAPEVSVRGLTAGYRRGTPVLEGVDLRALPGRVLAVVGPNGAGKTTLFRAILGFLPGHTGSVEIGGRPPAEFRRLRGIGYLPEVVGLPAGWRVEELLREGAGLSGVARAARKGAAAAALEEGRLTAPRRRVETLSKGTARRVALAWALLGDPSLLVLDEPWSGLDPPARLRLCARIRAVAAAGRTVIVASHELGEVARVADSAVALRDGAVVARLSTVSRDGLEAVFTAPLGP